VGQLEALEPVRNDVVRSISTPHVDAGDLHRWLVAVVMDLRRLEGGQPVHSAKEKTAVGGGDGRVAVELHVADAVGRRVVAKAAAAGRPPGEARGPLVGAEPQPAVVVLENAVDRSAGKAVVGGPRDEPTTIRPVGEETAGGTQPQCSILAFMKHPGSLTAEIRTIGGFERHPLEIPGGRIEPSQPVS